VVGAGLGRTGTNSLKLALEQLLGGRCYHMSEAFERPQDSAVWLAAARNEEVDWQQLLADFDAIVDWPGASLWRQILAANPGALVLLSTRDSAESWWRSVEQTIVPTLQQPIEPGDEDRLERRRMILALLEAHFTPDWSERDAAIAAYERHNDAVRGEVPPERLIDWRPGDGWEPICAALGLAVPAEPFPHTNASAEFRSEQGLES